MDRFPCQAQLLAIALSLTAPAAADDTVMPAVTAALQQPVVACDAAHLDPQRLAPYYSASPAPYWLSARGPNARAVLLRATLQNAGHEGLTPARYGLDAIEAHWPATAPAERACLELLLTAGFDRYSRDLRRGRVGPHEADPSWMLRPSAFDPVAALQVIGSDRDFASLLESLPPAHAAYARLRAALQRYRQHAAPDGWPALPPGPALAPGDVHEQVPAVRARLRREGDLGRFALSFGTRYDAALELAVQRYQRRHGLESDGVVGARTRVALNVPAAERIAQLQRAMERLRWLPRELGNHYILANTAGFELTVIENDRTVLGMRTINGTPDQATPSFVATLQTLIVNPYWYVPKRIERDKLWPREQRQPGYLLGRGFRIFDTRNGGWQELEPVAPGEIQNHGGNAGLRLRQDPGPDNLMGRLSFVLPNPFDIFLHDTPDRRLFERATRTFSEGCVRVENAMVLALHALRRDPAWNEARIQEEIDALRHRNLPLPEPIPVYVLYLPTWVDAAGQVQFRDDVYRRESVLASYFPAD